MALRLGAAWATESTAGALDRPCTSQAAASQQTTSRRARPGTRPIGAARAAGRRAWASRPKPGQRLDGRLHALAERVRAGASVAEPPTRSTWPATGGQLVDIWQQHVGGAHQLVVTLHDRSLPAGARPELHWGVYRSSPHKWQHPEGVVPPGSYPDARSGAMRSTMAPNADDPHAFSIQLTVPAALAPLTLAFVIHVPASPGEGAAGSSGSKAAAGGHYVSPLRGRHFSELIGAGAGAALPLGASLAASGGVNFAIESGVAERLSLVVFRPPAAPGGPWRALEISLDPVVNRTGDTWHAELALPGDISAFSYAWRVDGDVSWEGGNRFDPGTLLLDPHAPLLQTFPGQSGELPGLPAALPELRDAGAAATAGVASSLAGLAAPAGPAPQPLGRPLEGLVALELDVRTFAQGPEVRHPGTYLGLAERLPFLQELGINALLLMPCYAASAGPGALRRSAASFLAPDPQLSTRPEEPAAAAAEFKAMVEAAHAAGIEVILQFDFTLTAEGTDECPTTLSLRGLDYSRYYRPNGVLNCGSVPLQQYLQACLRSWVLGYGVDGFCFPNAENMAQDRAGVVLDAPPLAEALCFDPVLSRSKLIAAPSDDALLPRGGVRGFPHWGLWQQRGRGFGSDTAAFFAACDPGSPARLAARLMGSADLFDAQRGSDLPGNLTTGRRPSFGFNSVTWLGRQSAKELAADIIEAAAAAGGDAAPAGAPPSAVAASKSLIALLAVSQGTPVLTQDAVASPDAARFAAGALRLRGQLAELLLPLGFGAPRDLAWHGAAAGSEPDWDGSAATAGTPGASYLAFSVRHPDGRAVYVGLNPHAEAVTAALPPLPAGRTWARAVDTSLPPAQDVVAAGAAPAPVAGPTYGVAAKAVVVLTA